MPSVSMEVVKEQLIPDYIREAYLTQARRKKYPASYFLLVEGGQRKFPYKDPKTGEIHCGLLRAAITRAGQYGYKAVEEKARKLYESHCKMKKEGSEEKEKEVVEMQFGLEFVEKEAEGGHYVFGVVLKPEEKDAQGDVFTKEEIKQACWDYNKSSKVVKYRHKAMLKETEAQVVESYILPADITMGDKVLKEGTWVMRVEVKDDALWKEIEAGKLVGFSVGGHIVNG